MDDHNPSVGIANALKPYMSTASKQGTDTATDIRIKQTAEYTHRSRKDHINGDSC